MSAVLIYTDTQRINEEKSILTKSVPLYQAVYNAIKAMGITPSLQDISTLLQWTNNSTGQQENIKSFIINKLVDIAGPQSFNGIALNRDAIKSMIQIPDFAPLFSALNGTFQVYSPTVSATRINLLAISADVIAKVSDSDAQIEAVYTYFTKTTASAQLATELQAVCDALNTFDANRNGAYGIKLKGDGGWGAASGYPATKIPGVAYSGTTFVVSLPFIRKFEDMGGTTILFDHNV